MSQRMLPVVILAGGLAIRLRPITETIPKALVEVNGEPFVAHQLRLLRANEIERVVICAGYLGEMIQAIIGNGRQFGLQVEYSFDGPRLLGTAGAIKKALPLWGNACLVVYGDSYLPCDYRSIQTVFEQSGKLALMTVFYNQGQWDTSNVEFAEGRILAYDKQRRTPRMQYIDYGLGFFRRSAFDAVPDDQPYDLALVYQHLLQRDELAAAEVDQRFYEVGSFAGLEETRRYLASQAQASAERCSP